jgi:formylglycine-generating enzyme required for sulfatase activity
MKIISILILLFTFARAIHAAPHCSQVLSSVVQTSAHDLDKKIHDLTTLKILWDKRMTSSLSPAEIAIANYYPKRAQELLHATGMTHEQLNELLKQETLKRQGQEPRTTEQEEEKRSRELDTIKIEDDDFLAEHLVFLDVKPGKFTMGGLDNQVRTEITKPFAMMATQVTQIMWAKLKIAMGEKNIEKINPSYFKTGTDSAKVKIQDIEVQMKVKHPVENVSWKVVQEFIDGLNVLSSSNDEKIISLLSELIPGHTKGDFYDFPTEAQWEFIMRDRGNANKKYFDRDDDADLSNYAWFDKNSGKQTHAVATRNPRVIDGKLFYDLEGNVYEWTKDSRDAVSVLQGGQDPQITKGPFRAIRGGAWNYDALYLRSGYRTFYNPDNHYRDLGFRLVRQSRL